MDADKLVKLVNAHALANKPHRGVVCIITPSHVGLSDDEANALDHDLAECDDEANWPRRSPEMAEAEYIAELGEANFRFVGAPLVEAMATPREMSEDQRDYEVMRGNAQEMSDLEVAQQMADEQDLELERFNSNEEAEHARFAAGNSSNLVSDADANRLELQDMPHSWQPKELTVTDIKRRLEGLSCEEEDAEVGRLWGIDASRVEDGE